MTGRRAAIDWINFVPVHALQYALRALDTAFQRFFAGLGGDPKPRKKFKDDSFTLPAEDVEFKRLNKNHGAINLPKIGRVHFRGYRPLGGKLVSVTFSRKAGRWYVSCAWEQEIADPPKSEFPTLGMDRGITVFVALSDGRRYKPLNAFEAGQVAAPPCPQDQTLVQLEKTQTEDSRASAPRSQRSQRLVAQALH